MIADVVALAEIEQPVRVEQDVVVNAVVVLLATSTPKVIIVEQSVATAVSQAELVSVGVCEG